MKSVFTLLSLMVSTLAWAQNVSYLPHCDALNPDARGVSLPFVFQYNYFQQAPTTLQKPFLDQYKTLCDPTPTFSVDTREALRHAASNIGNFVQQKVDTQNAGNQCLKLMNQLNPAPGSIPAACPTTQTNSVASVEPPKKTPSVEAALVDESLKKCNVTHVNTLPGSGQFASDFIENIARDPQDPDKAYAITSDLSSWANPKSMFISKSEDGGKTWTKVARLKSDYFNAAGMEGLRNSISVSNGGKNIVMTSQKGAFELSSVDANGDAVMSSIPNPNRVSSEVAAGTVKISRDGKDMIVTSAIYQPNPQIVKYHREDPTQPWSTSNTKTLPLPPTLSSTSDILSSQIDPTDPDSFFIGTGNHAFHYNAKKSKWDKVSGTPDDTAVHDIEFNEKGEVMLMTCQGAFRSVKVVDGVTLVEKIMSKSFLFHGKPTAGSYLRAYSIDWDPHNPKHAIMASESGIYTSEDGGKTWKHFTNKDHQDADHYFPACVGTGKREANDFLQDNPQGFLPMGPCNPKTSAINEFRTAHFTADGSILVSGTAGTFLANPFGKGCESTR